LLSVLSAADSSADDALQEAFTKAALDWARISQYEDPAGWDGGRSWIRHLVSPCPPSRVPAFVTAVAGRGASLRRVGSEVGGRGVWRRPGSRSCSPVIVKVDRRRADEAPRRAPPTG
jgi:hypothetical protein